MSKKLDTLREREAALQARLQQIQSQRKEISRKEDTRRKVLIGSVILNRIALGLEREETLQAWLDVGLTRNVDRAVFGLPLLPETQENQQDSKPAETQKKVVAVAQVVVGTVENAQPDAISQDADLQKRQVTSESAESSKKQGKKKPLPTSKTQKELESEFM